MEKARNTTVIKSGKQKRSALIFYIVMFALPMIQFCVFYVGMNVNSILLSFKSFSFDTGDYVWAGFENFRIFFLDIIGRTIIKTSFINSMILYAAGLLAGVTLSLMFSFYIYKKFAGHKLFKIFLFLPSIISIVIMSIMFKYITERAYPELMMTLFRKAVEGPLSMSSTQFGTIVFFSIWSSFGTTVLLYAGAMGQISDSLVESLRLETSSDMREFWHLTLPSIYPTICTFLVVGVAGIFINQGTVHAFFLDKAPLQSYTLGYFLFTTIIGERATMADYPYAAAAGICMTIVAVPLTLLVRYLLDRFGPKEV